MTRTALRRMLAAALMLWALPVLAESNRAISLIIVNIPEQVSVAFSTNLDLRTFFRSARYDEAANVFIGDICVTGRTEAQLTFSSFAVEQPVTLRYKGEEVVATARILSTQDGGRRDSAPTLTTGGGPADVVCPEGGEPVELAIYLPEFTRGYDRSFFSGSLELFVRPI